MPGRVTSQLSEDDSFLDEDELLLGDETGTGDMVEEDIDEKALLEELEELCN